MTPLLTAEELRWVVTLMFALLLLLCGVLLRTTDDDDWCPQHKQARSRCKDNHRP